VPVAGPTPVVGPVPSAGPVAVGGIKPATRIGPAKTWAAGSGAELSLQHIGTQEAPGWALQTSIQYENRFDTIPLETKFDVEVTVADGTKRTLSALDTEAQVIGSGSSAKQVHSATFTLAPDATTGAATSWTIKTNARVRWLRTKHIGAGPLREIDAEIHGFADLSRAQVIDGAAEVLPNGSTTPSIASVRVNRAGTPCNAFATCSNYALALEVNTPRDKSIAIVWLDLDSSSKVTNPERGRLGQFKGKLGASTIAFWGPQVLPGTERSSDDWLRVTLYGVLGENFEQSLSRTAEPVRFR
jgi:hypothetical protein